MRKSLNFISGFVAGIVVLFFILSLLFRYQDYSSQERWPKFPYAAVRAYSGDLDNPEASVDNGDESPKIRMVTLNQDQLLELKAAINSFYLVPNPGTVCSDSHNGLVFFNGSGNIIGTIKIGFACNSMQYSPTRGGNFSGSIHRMRDLFTELGLPVD